MKRPAVLAASLAVAVAATTGLVAAPPARALNDPLFTRQWGLAQVHAPAAWNRGLFGQGIEIAVLDTGVHLTHQDLAPNLGPGHNVIRPGTSPQDDQCDGDDCGHGTHVAGIAAAAIDNGGSVGVAPRARILPVKVLGADGSGTTDGVAAGIRWAVANGADVVNLSLSSDLQPLTGPSSAIIDAVRAAWAAGVICVFAAGNSFVLDSGFADEPAVVVSATNRREAKPDFSSGVGEAKWSVAAPGGGNTVQFEADENIWSTAWDRSNANDGYTQKRGTSMAAPFVAGAAALLRSAGLGPAATVERLLATAKDLGSNGKDTTFGHGLIDLAEATEGLSAPGAGGGPGGGGPGGGGSGDGGGGGGGPATTSRPPAGGAPRTTVRNAPAGTAPPAAAPTTTAAPAAPADEPTVDVDIDAEVDALLGGDEQASDGGGRDGGGDDGDGDAMVPLALVAAALAVGTGSAIPLLARRRRRRDPPPGP